MDYTFLGDTGLKVSVAGLGCGGNSRLGLSRGKSIAEVIALIHAAVDLGVNFLDTAAAYGTEEVVGKAVKELDRESVIISTKSQIKSSDGFLSADEVVASLEQSLQNLATDYVDVFHLHAIRPEMYDYALNELAPELLKQRDKGKLRHLGITESPPFDPSQEMLQRAVHDDCWEVMMLGFHMLNQKARQRVFPVTQTNGIGTLLMFVVRNIFSAPGYLQNTMRELVEQNKVPQWLAESDDPLGFLVHQQGASSVVDAAYRYARHEPGADVILFGTSEISHLKTNVKSILKPPLPIADQQKLAALFGELEGIGLDLPTKKG